MQRFFFYTADGGQVSDHDGTQLPDLAAAKIEAIRYAGAVMADDPGVLAPGHDFRVQVRDASDKVLFEVKVVTSDGIAAATS